MSEITYTVSEGTTAAIASLVEAKIAREYGKATIDGKDIALVEQGARMLIEAGVNFDGRAAFIAFTGGDRGLNGWIALEISRLVTEGLKARECQCRQLPNGGLFRNHGHRYTCTSHYESDVPPIDGLLLCGDCHITEWQARQ